MEIMNNQDKEIESRDKNAAEYEKQLLSYRGVYRVKTFFHIVRKRIKLSDNMSVYDSGAGVGLVTIMIAEKYNLAHLLAVDFSSASIKELDKNIQTRGLKNIKTVAADITQFIPPKNEFDRAICLDVLHYIPTHEQRLNALNNLFIGLKPGGIALVYVYRWGGLIRPPNTKENQTKSLYRFSFTKDEIIEIMKSAGFTEIKVEGMYLLPRKFRRKRYGLVYFPRIVESFLMRFKLFENHAEYWLATGKKNI